jgi:predicted HTH transcriptional regulator
LEEWVSDIGSMSDAELKGQIGELASTEQEISYSRRILHGKIDLLRAELVNRLRARHDAGQESITDADVAKLTDLITAAESEATPGGPLVDAELETAEETGTSTVNEGFPDLSELSDPELKDLIRKLTEEEREISYQRRILHGKIDILRAELVNRMRTQREEGEATITGEDIEQLTEILSGRSSAPAEGE